MGHATGRVAGKGAPRTAGRDKGKTGQSTVGSNVPKADVPAAKGKLSLVTQRRRAEAAKEHEAAKQNERRLDEISSLAQQHDSSIPGGGSVYDDLPWKPRWWGGAKATSPTEKTDAKYSSVQAPQLQKSSNYASIGAQREAPLDDVAISPQTSPSAPTSAVSSPATPRGAQDAGNIPSNPEGRGVAHINMGIAASEQLRRQKELLRRGREDRARRRSEQRGGNCSGSNSPRIEEIASHCWHEFDRALSGGSPM